MEAQLKFVNSNKEGMKIENHFKDEGGEFDQVCPLSGLNGWLDMRNEVTVLTSIEY